MLPKTMWNLKQLLEKHRVRAHPDFLPEFIGLIKNSGQERIILTRLYTCLRMSDELGEDRYATNNFERLKDYGNLCSLRIIVEKVNMRILYSEDPAGQIWLHSFFKRAGKKKTDYAAHIPIAIERRNEVFR